MSNKDLEEQESGVFVGNFHCIASECDNKKGCNSSDALSCYEKEDDEGEIYYDGYCRSCTQFISKKDIHTFDDSTPLKQELADLLGIAYTGVVSNRERKVKTKAKALEKHEVKAFIKEVGYNNLNLYRGITDETDRFYGCLTKVNPNGDVLARYYPETDEYKVSGYACRNHPKDFRYGRVGRTGSKSNLYGQIKFKKGGGKYLLVTGGQEDCHAAFQMLRDSQKMRGQEDYEPIAVVSVTTGETSGYKQLAREYDWIDTFENIIIGFDSDEAGEEATKSAIEVLPKDKVKVAKWSGKDPNKMLIDGRDKQFVRDFYNSRLVKNDGIKSSNTTMEAILNELSKERLKLPEYMHRMEAMMGGGILDCTITNIIAATSTGKSSHVNNMVYTWIFNSPTPIAVISLEATEGQWGIDILSLHLGVNLRWMKDQDREEFLNKPEIIEKSNELWFNEYGQPRFFLVDERDGDITKMEKILERLNKQYGCRTFVIDVLSDALAGTSLEVQQNHMKWQKFFIKDGNRLINILHTRKQQTSKDGKAPPLSEYDSQGSGDLVRSAAINILLEREKESGDDIIRNTTNVRMPKCRGGITGEAGSWYYDFNTRKCYDLEDYMNGKPKSITTE